MRDRNMPRIKEMGRLLRVSPEGQEGLGAFLAKRPPAWVVPD